MMTWTDILQSIAIVMLAIGQLWRARRPVRAEIPVDSEPRDLELADFTGRRFARLARRL